MPTISFDGRASLDIASYGRKGPGRRDHVSSAEVDHIRRTVRRTPEVMVKVLSHGGQDLKSIGRHFDYLGRNGDLDIETDDVRALTGKGAEKALLEDWDLDVGVLRRRPDLEPRKVRNPPKLVHKLMFSMPAGTPPDKVFAAVKNFAREEFGLQHRYAMVLHTDEPHPHAHMVIKAMSEHGVRLNIKKATLRAWRAQFAAQLRKQGIAANATERAVRGFSKTRKTDGIYRAARRGYSSHLSERARSIAQDLRDGVTPYEPGRATVHKTGRQVGNGWQALGGLLEAQGLADLAREVRRFNEELPTVRTEGEWVATELRNRPDLAQRSSVPLYPPPPRTNPHVGQDLSR